MNQSYSQSEFCLFGKSLPDFYFHKGGEEVQAVLATKCNIPKLKIPRGALILKAIKPAGSGYARLISHLLSV